MLTFFLTPNYWNFKPYFDHPPSPSWIADVFYVQHLTAIGRGSTVSCFSE